VIGIGARRDRLRREGHGFEGALVDEAVDDPDTHPGRDREVAFEMNEPALRRRDGAAARRRRPFRRRAGKTYADARHLGAAFFRQLQGE
jgi:hypothetical protein